VEVISGACLLTRREVFEGIGLFSEEYFMYAEDADLCYKAAKSGWRCYYVREATVVHHGGGSSRLRSARSWSAVVQCGAKLQFIRKTRGPTYANLYRLAMAASAAIRWLLLASACVATRPQGGLRSDRFGATRAKWSAVFRWALRPNATLQHLTTVQAN
jgi:GT2 family glycosyltransferase